MNEALSLTLAAFAGGLLGTLFFGGLWWTVRKGMSSPRPAFWFLGSALVRTGVVVAGFYFGGRDDWRRLVAGLLGFVVARLVVIRATQPIFGKSGHRTEETRHAP